MMPALAVGYRVDMIVPMATLRRLVLRLGDAIVARVSSAASYGG